MESRAKDTQSWPTITLVQAASPIHLASAALYRKLVTAHRGGHCCEHNSLFLEVLRRQFDIDLPATTRHKDVARVKSACDEVLMFDERLCGPTV